MELKLFKGIYVDGNSPTFNRTIMELKPKKGSYNALFFCLLIVPLWNWNNVGLDMAIDYNFF